MESTSSSNVQLHYSGLTAGRISINSRVYKSQWKTSKQAIRALLPEQPEINKPESLLQSKQTTIKNENLVYILQHTF